MKTHSLTRLAGLLILSCLLLLAAAAFAALGDSGGTGTTEDPYIIDSKEELEAFRDAVIAGSADICAKLTADINLEGSSTDQWTPIGSGSTRPFSGKFDGSGHTISGLYISAASDDCQGLFGYVSGDAAEVRNLVVRGTVSGGNNVGGLIGKNDGGMVSDCKSECDMVGGSGNVGGIVGYNAVDGAVINCAAECNTVSETRVSVSVGGVVGYNGGTVSSCKSECGAVSGSYYVGGVVGTNCGAVINCKSGCDRVSGTGGSVNVGGCVGNNRGGMVSNCAVKCGTVSGTGGGSNSVSVNVGGVVGHNYGGTVTNCTSTGAVTGVSTGYGKVGGIVGYNYDSFVTNCVSSSDVTYTGPGPYRTEHGLVGGIVGEHDREPSGSVSNCAAFGEVTGTGGTNIHAGGIAGRSDGIIKNCASECAAVSGTNYVGGIVGHSNGGTVINCGWWKDGTHGVSADAHIGNNSTSADVVSYDAASAGKVAVTCLPETFRLSVVNGAGGTVALKTYPASVNATILGNYITNANPTVSPDIATSTYANGVITVTGTSVGTGVIFADITFRPTWFNGGLNQTSADVSLNPWIALTVKAPESEPQVNPFTPVNPRIADVPDGVENTEVAPMKDKAAAVAATGIEAKNLELDEAANVVPTKEFTDAAARDAFKGNTEVEFVKATAVPIATATLSTAGNTATFAFEVRGDNLCCDRLANLKVIKIFADAAGKGKLFEIATTSADFTDKHVTILKDGEIYDGAIGANETYTLCAFVKDGETFDLDGTPNGKVVDPIAVAETKPAQRHSGGCCSTGFAALALLALAPIAARKRKS